MIDAVCFDLDGTIGGFAGDFAGLLSLVRTELMLEQCTMNSFADIVKQELVRDGPLTLKLVLERTLERLEQRPQVDLDLLSREIAAAYAAEVRQAQGAAALLARLDGKGIRLALLSNGPEDMQRAALAELGFERYFRVVLISGDSDVAVRKPGARIFTLACVGLETAPEHALMVGNDARADIGGALASGLQAVLIGSDRDAQEFGVPAVGGLEPLDTLLHTRFGV
ncbi:MAG TPA: HAD family hydrolase [Trueperaceae bacterium]|nr:HAD family hydrolase [Trueperaceae bacterium]